MKWQPIETAPKDGTEILGWEKMGLVVRAAWQDPWGQGKWSWHLGSCLAWGNEETECELTHWMPLPPAPEVQA